MSQTLRLGDIDIDEARLAELCQRYQVRELPVFGSAARGEMRPDSDIDPLVEFLPNADVGRSLGKWILKASASQSWLKCGWRVAMPGPSRPQNALQAKPAIRFNGKPETRDMARCIPRIAPLSS
jgi:hypothetical protein